jgi:hypothetical protein
MTRLRLITSQRQLEELQAAAKADGHAVPYASHMLVDDGKVVGGASLGTMPTVNLWAATEGVGPRDMLAFWQQIEAVLSHQRLASVVVVCSDTSPLKPYLERFSDRKLGNFALYHVSLEAPLEAPPNPL